MNISFSAYGFDEKKDLKIDFSYNDMIKKNRL